MHAQQVEAFHFIHSNIHSNIHVTPVAKNQKKIRQPFPDTAVARSHEVVKQFTLWGKTGRKPHCSVLCSATAQHLQAGPYTSQWCLASPLSCITCCRVDELVETPVHILVKTLTPRLAYQAGEQACNYHHC